MRLTSIHFFCLTFHKQKKALLPRLCTTIRPAFSTSAALASFVSNPRGVTGLLFFSFFRSHQLFYFLRVEAALNYAGVNEKTERGVGAAGQGPHVRVTKLTAAQWHSQPWALHR